MPKFLHFAFSCTLTPRYLHIEIWNLIRPHLWTGIRTHGASYTGPPLSALWDVAWSTAIACSLFAHLLITTNYLTFRSLIVLDCFSYVKNRIRALILVSWLCVLSFIVWTHSLCVTKFQTSLNLMPLWDIPTSYTLISYIH